MQLNSVYMLCIVVVGSCVHNGCKSVMGVCGIVQCGVAVVPAAHSVYCYCGGVCMWCIGGLCNVGYLVPVAL